MPVFLTDPFPMPDVVGFDYLDAQDILASNDLLAILTAVTSPGSINGIVLTQSTPSGADVIPGATITLTYAAEIAPRFLFIRHS